MKKHLFLVCAAVAVILTSCVSSNRGKSVVSRNLSDRGVKNSRQLTEFFMRNNPDADIEQVRRLASYYIEEGNREGINSDCAFVQMCHETGFLKFGNLVTPEMHNYCGLGAIDENQRGLYFETEQLGVRAHIQHLHAYAKPEGFILNNDCVDPRYRYVKRGRAPTIEGLAGTWAADREYAIKLENKLSQLERIK